MKKVNDITQEKIADVFKAERSHLLRYACYRLGNENDAKDVLQDTFLRLHTRIANADDLRINDLRSYLFRTLINVCAKWQNGTNRIKTIPLDMRMDVADASGTGDEADYRRIVGLLTEIPDEQAEVIRLRIYGDNSFAEVAEILSLPLPTVKSRFLYGLEKLRKGMKRTINNK
ncbi:MAG: RNA polymerase sigma factor [Prevotella sp.]|nr:RNA polymerase sigma factor [Prevotella sp.]